MKRLILITCLSNLLGFATIAQEIGTNGSHSNREKLYIRDNITLHFNSPEPIQYVDISSKGLVGVGQKFIAQYEVQYASGNQDLPTLLEITPENMSPLGIGLVPLTQNELREFSMDAYTRKEDETGLYNSQYGITGNVNHIHTLNDYIFLDITYTNETNLKFDIDQIRFRVEDKKIAKATNVQAIEMAPVFTLFEKENFKRKYRNIYVLEKFSFPNNKVLSIELTEKQLSGRNLILEIDYFDLLSADTL